MYPSVRDHIVLAAWPSLLEGLKEIDFDAVELEFSKDNSVTAIDPSLGVERFKLDNIPDIDDFRKHLETTGVKVSALLMSNNFGNEDLESEINWTISAIDAATTLGIPAVRIDAMMHGKEDFPLERNIDIFAEVMARVLDATPHSNVDMGIENHGFQGNQPEFLDKLLNKVGSPRVGITLDTGNFYWWGHPLSEVYKIIEHFAPHCKHTHAKNIQYPPETRETKREVGWEYGTYVSTLWEGDIDHRRVVEILKSAGYDRDLCLEDESLGKFPKEKWRSIIKQDADFFLKIL